MTEGRPLLVDRDDHVMIVTINRPEVHNAVDLAVAESLGDALHEADRDVTVRSVVITGAGDRAFCAGADLKAVARGEAINPTEGRGADWWFAGFVNHHISTPVLAAVNGLAYGGGAEIVLHADLAVAARSARFAFSEVMHGLIAGGGGAFRATRHVPHKFAMEMLLLGDPITADQAWAAGFVNRVVEDGSALEEALRMAHRIGRNAPLAVRATKRLARDIVDGRRPSEDEQWRRSKEESARLMNSGDAREGVAAFVEGLPPVWGAR